MGFLEQKWKINLHSPVHVQSHIGEQGFWARDTCLDVWVLQAYLSVGLFTYPCPLIQFMIGLLPEGGANLRKLLGGQTHPP